MKILSRITAVVLLLALTIALAFVFYGGTGESGSQVSVEDCIVPKYDYFYRYNDEDKFTMTFGQITDKPFADGEEAGNNCVNSLWEETLNANFEIKYSATSSNISTLVNVSMISNDLPDVTPCSETLFGELYEQDMLCDLTEYYEYYASPALKQILEYNTMADLSQYTEEEKETLSGCNLLASAKKNVDGEDRLYAIPLLMDKYTYCPYLWIREDWLAQWNAHNGNPAGKMPVTRQEVIDMAWYFKTNISGCSYPIYSNNVDFLYEWFGGIPAYYLQDYENGEWSYSTTNADFKRSLENVRALISNKLLDGRIFSEPSNAMAEVKNGNVGIYIGYFWQPQGGDISLVSEQTGVDWKVAPLCDENGNVVEVFSRPNIQNYYVVSSKCEHPELLFLMLNHMVEQWVNPDSEESTFIDDQLALMDLPKYEEVANYVGEWGPVIFDIPDKNFFMSQNIREVIANNGTEDDLRYKYAKYNFRLIEEYIDQNQTPKTNNYNWIYYKIFYESAILAENFFDKINYGGYFGTATTGMLNYAVSISNVESVYVSRMLLQPNSITDEQFNDFKSKLYQAGVEDVLEELKADYTNKWWKGGSAS